MYGNRGWCALGRCWPGSWLTGLTAPCVCVRFFPQGPVDMDAALEFYALGCKGYPSDLNGCRAMGLVYLEGDHGVDKHLPRAKKYLRKACQGGLHRACHELGLALWAPGQPVETTTSRAAKLHRRACDADPAVPEACVALAEMAADGQGVKRNRGRAATLLRKGCDLAHGPACTRLGLLTAYGYGTADAKEDKVGALRLYERACEYGDVMGCSAAGTDYAEGNGVVAVDTAKAARLLSKACIAEYEAACAIMKRLKLELVRDAVDHDCGDAKTCSM